MTRDLSHRFVVALIAMVVSVFALMIFAAIAHAEDKPRAELGAGLCRQSLIGDGVWYQSAYPYSASMTASCGLFAVSAPVARKGNYGLGVRVAYVDLGTIRINSTFAMRDDEAKVAPSGANCNTSTMSGCVGRGSAAQNASGISVGLTGERSFGGLTLGAEAGGFLYYSRFVTNIDAYPDTTTFGRVRLDWGGLQVTPYVGVNARYEYAMVMLRAYGEVRAAQHGCGGCSGFSHSTAVQVLGGLSVPF